MNDERFKKRVAGQRKPAHGEPADEPLAYPLGAETIGGAAGWTLERQFTRAYWLLVATDGRGELEADGRAWTLGAGRCYLLAPGTLVGLASDAAQPVRLYRVAFDVLRPAGASAASPNAEPSGGEDTEAGEGFVAFRRDRTALPYCGELAARHFHKIASLAGQLCEPGDPRGASGGGGRFRKQRLLLELLDALPGGEGANEADATGAVESALAYMNRHYAEELTRESLAAIAGMSEWHFAHTFKRRVGKSPMDCLNDIRMGKAKEKLLLTNGRVRDIALEVGFRDEFYFSRKFKKTVGLSPAEFQKQKLTNIASLSFPYTGHLLALGVIPRAASFDDRRDRHRQPLFAHVPYHLRRAKTMDARLWEHNVNELLRARPGLILCDDASWVSGSGWVNKIAPTIAIPWLRHDWRGHFRQIAALLGKEKEACDWLRAYDEKARLAALRLRETVGGQTVTILHILLGQAVVYGSRNGGGVLYGDLKLACAYDPWAIPVLKEIGEPDLAAYAGDHILLVVDADEPSQRGWERLRQSAAWRSLPAVRHERVHRLHETPLLDYSPYAHDQVIDETLRLFCR